MNRAKVLGAAALCAALCAASGSGMSEVDGAAYFTEKADGFGGEVTVIMGVKDGVIVEVTAEGPAETDGIGSRALEELPGRMLEGQTWEVDGVSGATYTSKGVCQAAKQCMTAAGLIEEEQTQEEIVRVDGAEYYTAAANGFMGEVDVIIGVKDGKLVDVIARGDQETKGIGTTALEQLPEKMLKAQSWEVDGVSGATLTSRAVKNAAKLAMIDAGLIDEE